MSLKSAFAKVQKSGEQLYLKLAQFFEENPLIREIWTAMAQDMAQQTASLDRLPSHFWKLLKSDEEAPRNAIRECLSFQVIDENEDRSLHRCFVRSLDIEEPLVLNAYVPLIRLLRTEPSNHALDLYIILKSHVTRISRMIQPFSVDPTLLQRVQNLQQRFEFEVQAPAVARALPPKMAVTRKKSQSTPAIAARKTRKARVAARSASRALPLTKRVQRIAKRAKPLVRELEIARGRAQR